MAQMRYAPLGSSGMRVSPICLGTMMFGAQTSEADSKKIIDHAAESGINFIDTANVYANGASETVLGNVLKATRNRWVVATKVAVQTGANVTDAGLSRRHIMQAADASLKRLQTDHIDLYYTHRVDPRAGSR
jgi:aryl-alcohol dehydrogenase (NADP+)